MANTDLSPGNNGDMAGSSYMYRQGTTPNTRTVVSQKIRILAPCYGGTPGQLYQIGVMGNFSPTQDRTIDPVSGIGNGDIIAELVPGMTGAMTASVERTMLYLANLWQTTGYASGVSGPVRSLRHHRWPFDVLQQMVFSVIADFELADGAGVAGTGRVSQFGEYGSLPYGNVSGPRGTQTTGSHNILMTMHEACWWNAWSTAYQKDTAIVAESGTMTITDVHDFSSTYGEFTPSGNDPSIGQGGSMRFAGLIQG